MNDDREHETPPVVIGSIALGVGPLPFLAVYAVLFIARGVFYPVQPPDITTSRAGEAIAGIVALVLLFAVILTIWWFLNGRRRWPFVLGQLATFGTALDFVLDSTTGSPAVPIVLLSTSGVAVVLAFLPPSWAHVGSRWPPLPRRPPKPNPPSKPDGPSNPSPSATGNRYVGRRRIRRATDTDDKSDVSA